jgi:hypothetical protein
MIFLEFKRIETVDDAKELLQMAIELEFSTLPPYLYALYSIRPMPMRSLPTASRRSRWRRWSTCA